MSEADRKLLALTAEECEAFRSEIEAPPTGYGIWELLYGDRWTTSSMDLHPAGHHPSWRTTDDHRSQDRGTKSALPRMRLPHPLPVPE